MQKLVALLRVKDGILFVHTWLERMDKLVDEIVVVDNGSTDGTYEILANHQKVAEIAKTEGFDEGRDKILLYDLARKRNPDWCIWLDIDEIFEDHLTRKKLDRMMSSTLITKYRFRRFHFFGDDKHFEIGGKTFFDTVVPSRTLWKEQPSGYFKDQKIHNGDIKGIKGWFYISKSRIKHICNLEIEYRKNAYNNYIKVDPSRKHLYEKDKENLINQDVKTWRWYERSERPLFIFLMNFYFNFTLVYKILLKRLFKR